MSIPDTFFDMIQYCLEQGIPRDSLIFTLAPGVGSRSEPRRLTRFVHSRGVIEGMATSADFSKDIGIKELLNAPFFKNKFDMELRIVRKNLSVLRGKTFVEIYGKKRLS